MGSFRPSNRAEKKKEPYFGAYHRSTSAASKKIRAVIKTMFTDAFASSLPFRRVDELRILDVGCGLGFLSRVSDEFYNNAQITGIDTFKHASLKGSSLEKAKDNARILGFSDRIDFKNEDVFSFTSTEKFDIIVSNLVFHNLGKKRFEAYSRLSSWTQAGSFVVMGDLFLSSLKTDIAHLDKAFRIIREIKPKRGGLGQYSVLVMSKDSKQGHPHGLS